MLYIMYLFVWILSCMILAISLLLLSTFDEEGEELLKNMAHLDHSLTRSVSDVLSEPQERLQNLNRKINTKAARLQISLDKIDETKKTICELEKTSLQVHMKYSELLKQLKLDLAKTEKECLCLHFQIERIADKRDQLRMKLQERQFPIQKGLGICSSENLLKFFSKRI